MKAQIYRASIFHTVRNPFSQDDALEYLPDAGLLVENGRIAAIGEFSGLARSFLADTVHVHDFRGGFLLPGFIDTHVHFPQVRIIGSLGAPLLEWLTQSALPEEARLIEPRVGWNRMPRSRAAAISASIRRSWPRGNR